MLLLITGCINVHKNMPYLTVRNIEQRLKEYYNTIRWAITETNFDKIVFCENSNYKIDTDEFVKLASNANKKFEYLTFAGDTYQSNKKGKGYGEGEIVKFAIAKSKLLADEKKFFKITGRLKVLNIDSLVQNTNRNYFMIRRNLKQVDTRIYCIDKEIFLKILVNTYVHVDDNNGRYLEHVYYDALKTNKVRFRTFYHRPLFSGVSGTTGKKYDDKAKRNEWITTILYRSNIYNNEIIWNIISKLKRIIKRIIKKQ